MWLVSWCSDYDTVSLIDLYRYASRVKLITNDAQKNSENKEIARLKGVSIRGVALSIESV